MKDMNERFEEKTTYVFIQVPDRTSTQNISIAKTTGIWDKSKQEWLDEPTISCSRFTVSALSVVLRMELKI